MAHPADIEHSGVEAINLTAVNSPCRHYCERCINNAVNALYSINKNGFCDISNIMFLDTEEVLNRHDMQLRSGVTINNYATILIINNFIIYNSYELAEAAIHAQSAAARFKYAKNKGRCFNNLEPLQLRKQLFKCAKSLLKRNLQSTTYYDVSSKKTDYLMFIILSAVGEPLGK